MDFLFPACNLDNYINFACVGNTNLSTAANIQQAVNQPKREVNAQYSALDSKSTPDDVKPSGQEAPVKQPKKRGRKKIKVDPSEFF